MNQSILALVVGVIAVVVVAPFAIAGFRQRLAKFRHKPQDSKDEEGTDR